MNHRENMLRALKRDNPRQVPFEFTLCPALLEEFKKRTGRQDYENYYGFPFRYINLNKTRQKIDYSIYYDNLPGNAAPLHWNPEWGVMGLTGSLAHFQEMLHPLEKFKTPDQIDQYPFPDFNEDYRWQGVREQVQKMIAHDLVAVAPMQMTVFEVSWYLRGMDTFMLDLISNKEFAHALMDKITDIRIGMARRFARCGADILMLGDDVATQLDMMLSPDLWRSALKPRLERIIQAARREKPDILIFYHCDGNVQKIIPELIEIGIDILNPVQPECMNPYQLKQWYGDRLSFWGAVGTQSVLPFGRPEEIKQTCKLLIERVGKGGGLLLAPTHVIEPDVPWENLQTFIDAVKEYGLVKGG